MVDESVENAEQTTGGKKKPKRKPKEERIQEEVERRERVIKLMKEHGFPITDEAVIDYMDMYYGSLEEFYGTVGRPTKYFPELDEWAIWLGNRGYSLKQISSIFGISNSKLYQWGEDNPTFGEALARAREGAQTWWETIGQASLFSKNFNTFVWNKIISARFRKDYTDRKGLPYDPKEPETLVGQGQVLELDPRDLTEEQKKVLRIAIAKATKQETE